MKAIPSKCLFSLFWRKKEAGLGGKARYAKFDTKLKGRTSPHDFILYTDLSHQTYIINFWQQYIQYCPIWLGNIFLTATAEGGPWASDCV